MQYSGVCCYSFMDEFNQETCPVKFGGRKKEDKRMKKPLRSAIIMNTLQCHHMT